VHAEGLVPPLVVGLVSQLKVCGGVRVGHVCRLSRRLRYRSDLLHRYGYLLFNISFDLIARSLIAEVHKAAAEHQAQQTWQAYVYYQ
jgi:hypothetical protein